MAAAADCDIGHSLDFKRIIWVAEQPRPDAAWAHQPGRRTPALSYHPNNQVWFPSWKVSAFPGQKMSGQKISEYSFSEIGLWLPNLEMSLPSFWLQY